MSVPIHAQIAEYHLCVEQVLLLVRSGSRTTVSSCSERIMGLESICCDSTFKILDGLSVMALLPEKARVFYLSRIVVKPGSLKNGVVCCINQIRFPC